MVCPNGSHLNEICFIEAKFVKFIKKKNHNQTFLHFPKISPDWSLLDSMDPKLPKCPYGSKNIRVVLI